MVNESELLINVVNGNKLKMLTGLSQKARSGAVKIEGYNFLQRRCCTTSKKAEPNLLWYLRFLHGTKRSKK